MADKLSILVNTILHTDEGKMQSQLNALAKKAKMTINPRVDLSPESVAKFKDDIAKMARQLKVNLVVGVDKSSLSTAEKAVQNAAKKVSEKANQTNTKMRVFDKSKLENEGRDFILSSGKIVENVKKKFASMGDVNVSFLKNSKNNITGFIAEITKANGKVEQLKYNFAKIDTGNGKRSGYVFDSSKLVDKNAGKNLQDMLNQLQRFDNRLNDLKNKFTSPTTGIQDVGNLANLNNKYNEIKNTIEQTKNSSNNLSNEQRRGIIQSIADLNRLITQYKDLQNAQKQSANSSRSTQDIDAMVNKWENAIARMKVGKDKVFQNKDVIADLQLVNSAINNFQRGTGSVEKVNSSMDNLRTRVTQVSDSFRNVNKDGYSFGSMIELAAKKVAIWAVSTQLIYGTLRQLKEGFDFIKESSSAFTTLQMEMTDTNLVFKDVLSSANDYAQALGNTTSNVMKAIGVFSTYASTMDDVLSKSKSATVLSNLTGQSIESQADDIMGIMAQFKVEANDSMYVADTLAATARTLQIDYPKAIQEISSGVRTAGSVARESGASFEEFASMIGVVSEKTRKSGNEIANGLRTIFGRILNVGEEADAEQMKKVEKSLDGIGVKVRELGDSGDLRPIGAILADLASKWNTLTEAQKQEVSFESAGMYRKNIFMTLMDNYGQVIDTTTSKIESQGVAMEKQGIYNESLEATLNRLKGVWEEFWIKTANLDSIKSAAKGILYLSETFGNLKTILTVAATALLLWKGSALTSMISGFYNVGLAATLAGSKITMFNQIGLAMQLRSAGMVTTFQAVGASAKAMGASILGAFASNPLGWIAIGITGVVTAMSYFNQQSEEMRRNIEDTAEKAKEETDSLNETMKTIENLTSLQELDAQQKTDLISAQENITKALGLEKKAIDLTNTSREKTIALLREETAEKLEQQQPKFQAAYNQAKKDANTRGQFENSVPRQIEFMPYNWDKVPKSLGLKGQNSQKVLDIFNSLDDETSSEKIVSQLQIILDLTKDYGNVGSEAYTKIANIQDKHQKKVDKENDSLQILNQSYALIAKQKALNTLGTPTEETIGDFTKEMQDNVSDMLNGKKLTESMVSSINQVIADTFPNLAKSAEDTAQQTKDSIDSIFSKSSDELTKSIAEKQAKLSDIKNQMASGSKDPELGIKSKELTGEITLIELALEKLANTSGETTDKMVKDAETLAQEYQNITNSIKLLAGAQQEMAEGDLSNNTIQELITQYPQLLAYMNDENALQEQVSKLLDDEMNKRRDNLQSTLEINEAYFNNTVKGNEDMWNLVKSAYDQDLNNFNSVADAKKETNKFLIQYLGDTWSKLYSSEEEALQGVLDLANSQLDGLDGTERAMRSGANSKITSQASAQLELLRKLRSGIDDTVKKTESITLPEIKTNSDKSSKDEKEVTAKEIELLKNDRYKQLSTELNEINALLNKNKNLQEIINENDKDYLQNKIKLLDEEIALITQKQEKEHQIANEKRQEMSEIRGRLSSQGVTFDEQGNITNQQAILNKRTADLNNIAGQINTSSKTITQNIGYPAEGNISSKYGMRIHPISGQYKMHNGIDIGAAGGSAARTLFGGSVLETGYDSGGYGNYVKVKTAEGITELFAHLSKIMVQTGQNISANTQIGAVGSTGASTGNHLHYETSKNGQRVDPLSLIGSKQTIQTAVKNNEQYYDTAEKQYKTFMDDIESYTKIKSEELPNLSDDWFADQKEKLQLIQEKIELTVKAMEDEITDAEHGLFISQKVNPKNYDEQIRVYTDLQKKVHDIAEYYRSLGFDEESEVIQELQKKWWGYADTIKEVYSSVEEEQNSIYDDRIKGLEDYKQNVSEIEDKIVEIKRKKYEEDKDNELKALEETYNAFEKSINDKIKLLDKEKSAKDFKDDLSEKDKEITKTRTELNEVINDDSLSGKKKQKELQEKLDEQLKDKQDFLDDKALEKRKENLQSELDESKTVYDKNVKQINDKYDALLKEENLYAQARQMIINEEWETIQTMLLENAKLYEKGTGMFGDSIQKNIIANLEEAKNLMNEIVGTGGGASLDVQTGAIIRESEDNKKVKVNQGIAGRETWETVKSVEDRQEIRYNTAIANKDFELARRIREETQKVTGRLPKFITRFYSGGYTADSEGMAYLDKKELILNKIDTSNILKAVDITRNLSSFLNNFNIPTSSNSNSQTINMPINITVEKGSNIDENKLADVIKNKITQSIKNIGWKPAY